MIYIIIIERLYLIVYKNNLLDIEEKYPPVSLLPKLMFLHFHFVDKYPVKTFSDSFYKMIEEKIRQQLNVK